MNKRVSVVLSIIMSMGQLVLGQTNGQYTHDGFFMRFLLGGGSSKMIFESGDTDIEFNGFSTTFRFQIGGEISENLIAFGEVGAITIDDPNMKMGGIKYITKETLVSSSDIGGGLTYYLMPINIYLSGSILASMADIEYEEGSNTVVGESDYGLGLFVTLGKEWWVHEQWGLGVAIYAAYSNVPDKGNSSSPIKTTSFGISFSATFQ